jgi:hypothetical protein
MASSTDGIWVGRLLRANVTAFVLGCRVGDTDQVSFGGLVRVDCRRNAPSIFGLVYDVAVADDLMVKQLAISGGLTETQRQDQLERRQVPIEMSVLAVGFRDQDGHIHRRIPPQPPLNLDRVVASPPAEVHEFTQSLDYFRLVLRQPLQEMPVEQLMVAHIAQAHAARGGDDDWVLQAAQELIAQLRDDHATLLPLLEALREAIPDLKAGVPGGL